MKQIIALFLCFALMFSLGISALAAGTDDGTISVITKDSEKYFGTEYVDGCTKYVAANGSDKEFYDVTGDKEMDICDLVALSNNSVDFDASGTYDVADFTALCRLLIGAN